MYSFATLSCFAITSTLLAGIVTFVLCLYVCDLFNFTNLPKYIFETVKILSVMTSGIVIYVVINLVLRMEYAQELISRLFNRFKSTD